MFFKNFLAFGTAVFQKASSVFQKARAEEAGPLYGLLVLPSADEFRVSAQQHFRDFPSVELCRSCVYGRGYETVLKAVAQG